jgi:multiple sugar transport system substrate-binding protein
MRSNRKATRSRRDFLKLAAPAVLGPYVFAPSCVARASQNILRIARWRHFLPEFDQWFTEYARDWARQHDAKVELDLIPAEEIHARADAEVASAKGRDLKRHDLVMFPWPPAEYGQYAIDHTEIYQAVGSRHGNVNRIGHRSTFDPISKRYFAFADSWMPAPLHYSEDYWSQVGAPVGPIHYNDLRTVGKQLRAKLGIPCGLALGPSLEGNITLHTVLYAFGGRVLDADGNVTIYKSYGTITALKYLKALYEEAGSPDQFAWGPNGNARAMQAGKTSCTIGAISLLRGAERDHPDIAKSIMIRPPLLGPAGIMATPFVTSCSVIWKTAENKEGAKQFLVDLIDNFRTAYEKSQGCNFPTYQNTVPNLIRLLEKDARAEPSDKYVRLKDALHWTPNLGFPGYATPAAMEVFNTFVIPKMFASVAKGEVSAENAARAAEAEVKRISEKWKQISQSSDRGG